MASYIKTLKEDNGDITYPQTLGSAVLLTGGSDLETVLAGKASAADVSGKISIGDVQSTDLNTMTTSRTDSGWDRIDLGHLHIIWMHYDSGAATNDWVTIGTAPSDLWSGTMLLGRWNPIFAYSSECQSKSSSLDSANGAIKAHIVSPSGPSAGAFLVVIYK